MENLGTADGMLRSYFRSCTSPVIFPIVLVIVLVLVIDFRRSQQKQKLPFPDLRSRLFGPPRGDFHQRRPKLENENDSAQGRPSYSPSWDECPLLTLALATALKNCRISSPISAAWVSRAKCPVS